MTRDPRRTRARALRKGPGGLPRLRHRWHHGCFGRKQPRERMGGAPGVGDGSARREPAAAEHVDETRHKKHLAAMQMIGPLRVHDEAVGAVDGDDWAILPERPKRQPLECGRVLGRSRVNHEEIGDHEFCPR